MATPGELVEVVAMATGIENAQVRVHDQNLRAANLRSKSGRGLSAARVTPRDAAHLLTALLASALVKDSEMSVRRYQRTIPQKLTSKGGFSKSGIAELEALPAQHSFIDGLEALIAAAASGQLHEAQTNKGRKHVPAHIEVGALQPGTIADIRLAGLAGGVSVHVRYAPPTPWEEDTKASAKVVAAWERSAREAAQADFERYTRVTSRTIRMIGQALATTKGE